MEYYQDDRCQTLAARETHAGEKVRGRSRDREREREKKRGLRDNFPNRIFVLAMREVDFFREMIEGFSPSNLVQGFVMLSVIEGGL